MNEQPLTNGSSVHERTGVELPEPHFDDIAIASAQPVEPLANAKPGRWQRLAVLRRHVSDTVLIVILSVAIGFGTVAFGLAGLHRQLDREEAPTVVAEQPQPAKLVEITKSEKAQNVSPRPAVRKTQPRTNADGKPVARKVGELTN